MVVGREVEGLSTAQSNGIWMAREELFVVSVMLEGSSMESLVSGVINCSIVVSVTPSCKEVESWKRDEISQEDATVFVAA